MVAVIALVLMFRTSTALASAYGVSVSGTMLIDTMLLALVAAHDVAEARAAGCCRCACCSRSIEIAFLIANGVKFLDGAWFPVVLGIVVFTVLRTWRRGRELLHAEIRKEGIQLDTFLPGLMLAPPVRVPGTAIFMTAQTGRRAARAAAQPQAQQGAARAQCRS